MPVLICQLLYCTFQGAILGWEDLLEEDMVTYSNILAWRIPMDREAWQSTVHEDTKIGHDWVTKHTHGILDMQKI